MNSTKHIAAALMTAAGLTASWCGVTAARAAADDAASAGQRVENAADRAGSAAEQTGDKAERAAERAGDKAGSATESAVRKTESAAEKTGDAAKSAAQKTETASESAADQSRSATEAAADKTGAAAREAAGEDRNASASAGGVVAAPSLPAGIKAKEAGDAEGIRDVLASSAEAALTKGGFDDLVERLVDADRNRIGQNMPGDDQLKTLDGRVAQIQKAWKDKYGEDFDMKEDEVFAKRFIGVAQGEVQDPSQLARGWPVKATGRGESGTSSDRLAAGSPATSSPGAATARPSSNGAPVTGQGDAAQTASAREEGGALGESRVEARNLEQGRDVALVRVPGSHGAPELTVSLIHEKPDMWRIDVPDHVRGQKAYDNLLNQLTRLGEDAAQWPADKNDAYRYVSHCVLMAVLDVDGKQQGQQGLRESQRVPQPQSQLQQPQGQQSQQPQSEGQQSPPQPQQ